MEMKWIVLTIAVVMYLLVIIKQDKKVWFTSAAALLIIIAAVIFPDTIFPVPQAAETMPAGTAYTPFSMHFYALIHACTALVNWNVLMIYVGSMTIAALFIYSKVPARIADLIVDASRSTGVAIVLILAMTGIISIFVENVATVLVMAPIALALCKKLKINPTFFMVGLAVMSNLEGTATLVGDPPSMIFASYAGYNFNDFFVHSGRASIFFIIQAGMIAGCLFFYAFFAKQKDKPEIAKEPVISYFPGILLLVMIFGLAGISFIPTDFHYLSGMYVMALGITGVIWYSVSEHKSRKETAELIRGLDWETIFFLIGIFIVVGAIAETGLLTDFAAFLTKLTGGSVFAGFVLIIAVSVVISGFVDNVPYIIVMLPVAQHMAAAMNLRPELYMFALLIGSCLGGNLTPFGASANVVATGILKKEGCPMSFGGWIKLGGTFTVLTTAVSAAVLWLIWA